MTTQAGRAIRWQEHQDNLAAERSREAQRLDAEAKAVWPHKSNDLRSLWDSGMPTVQIGLILGVTKNAVIGRARRMKLTPRK